MRLNLNDKQKADLAASWINKKQPTACLVENKTLFLSQLEDNTAYHSCIIIIDCSDLRQVLSMFNCQIVDPSNSQIKTVPISLTYQFEFMPNYIGHERTKSNVLPIPSSHTVKFNEAYLLVYDTRLINYADSNFYFHSDFLVAGVELELPVQVTNRQKFFNNFWKCDSDFSQITGYLELQSMPNKAQYFRSCYFLRRLKTAYKHFKAPNNINDYVLPPDSLKHSGSGVHIHLSWAENGLLSTTLREAIYDCIKALGGADFLLDIGGKSPNNFDKYSPFYLGLNPSAKYQAVRVVNYSKTHIELRWVATSPDPEVTFLRIQAALDIVEMALSLVQDRLYSKSDLTLLKLKMLGKAD